MTAMKPSGLKKRLKAGETVLGVLSPNTEGGVVEALGLLGFGLYFLDAEHGSAGPTDAANVVRACEAAGMAALIRVRSLDPKLILQVLDVGMTGIMLPGVRSADEVRELVAAVKYPPLGRRGLGPAHSNAYFLGPESQADTVARANEETLVLPQVETLEALERVDELAAVPGVDGFIVGPRDLSMALGFRDGPNHPEVEAALDRVAQTARRAGLIVGTVAATGARARDLADRGYQILLHSVNGLLRTGAKDFFSAYGAGRGPA
jgi:4-hydroxy-2-oxoheptanedioate aldolase